MTDYAAEYPGTWFEKARLCSDYYDSDLNYFGVNAAQSILVWRTKEWIHHEDPRGWFQWHCRYFIGRRFPDDERQIKRWRMMRRHIFQIRQNCTSGDINYRRKQRQAVLHWSYDSRLI